VWQIPDAVDTVVCAPDDGWKYHPKHVEQFPDINKLCNVASCWIYEYIGILLGAHSILHNSRIRVNIFNNNTGWGHTEVLFFTVFFLFLCQELGATGSVTFLKDS
jgi:hypothetical protein